MVNHALDSYFGDSLEDSWRNCLAIWAKDGRTEDLPHGGRKPAYSPKLGKRLCIEFAKRYMDQYPFLMGQLESRNAQIALCAYEVLEQIAWEFGDHLPEEMASLVIPLPEVVESEIRRDPLYSAFTGTKIGEFWVFMLENG